MMRLAAIGPRSSLLTTAVMLVGCSTLAPIETPSSANVAQDRESTAESGESLTPSKLLEGTYIEYIHGVSPAQGQAIEVYIGSLESQKYAYHSTSDITSDVSALYTIEDDTSSYYETATSHETVEIVAKPLPHFLSGESSSVAGLIRRIAYGPAIVSGAGRKVTIASADIQRAVDGGWLVELSRDSVCDIPARHYVADRKVGFPGAVGGEIHAWISDNGLLLKREEFDERGDLRSGLWCTASVLGSAEPATFSVQPTVLSKSTLEYRRADEFSSQSVEIDNLPVSLSHRELFVGDVYLAVRYYSGEVPEDAQGKWPEGWLLVESLERDGDQSTLLVGAASNPGPFGYLWSRAVALLSHDSVPDQSLAAPPENDASTVVSPLIPDSPTTVKSDEHVGIAWLNDQLIWMLVDNRGVSNSATLEYMDSLLDRSDLLRVWNAQPTTDSND